MVRVSILLLFFLVGCEKAKRSESDSPTNSGGFEKAVENINVACMVNGEVRYPTGAVDTFEGRRAAAGTYRSQMGPVSYTITSEEAQEVRRELGDQVTAVKTFRQRYKVSVDAAPEEVSRELIFEYASNQQSPQTLEIDRTFLNPLSKFGLPSVDQVRLKIVCSSQFSEI